MKKMKVSLMYQVMYLILIIASVHSGVVRIFVEKEKMQLGMNLTIPLILLIGVYVINLIHFRKMKVENISWAPVIFTSSDEREQKIMDAAAATGFRSVLPFCLVLGFGLMFIAMIFIVFIGQATFENILSIISDIFWTSLIFPYIIYTMIVYNKIKKV